MSDLRPSRFPTFSEAYRAGLAELLACGERVPSVKDPTSIASNFGRGDRPAVELLGYPFEITESRPSLFNSSAHIINVPYAVGLFLWTAAGSDSVDWLSYYNERAVEFSQDGQHLCGAFGKRLFNYSAGLNQIELVVGRLKADPASRRGIGLVLTPEDNKSPDIDFPCALGTHYFLRHERLDAVVYMRAQHALRVLPYDQFVFACLQSLVAAMLGVNAGRYIHFAGTFHLYENEREHARKLIETDPQSVDFGHVSPGAQPLAALGELEVNLRTAALDKDVAELDRLAGARFPSGTFEEHARVVLTAHAFCMAGKQAQPFIARSELAPPMRTLLESQWSSS